MLSSGRNFRIYKFSNNTINLQQDVKDDCKSYSYACLVNKEKYAIRGNHADYKIILYRIKNAWTYELEKLEQITESNTVYNVRSSNRENDN